MINKILHISRNISPNRYLCYNTAYCAKDYFANFSGNTHAWTEVTLGICTQVIAYPYPSGFSNKIKNKTFISIFSWILNITKTCVFLYKIAH